MDSRLSKLEERIEAQRQRGNAMAFALRDPGVSVTWRVLDTHKNAILTQFVEPVEADYFDLGMLGFPKRVIASPATGTRVYLGYAHWNGGLCMVLDGGGALLPDGNNISLPYRGQSAYPEGVVRRTRVVDCATSASDPLGGRSAKYEVHTWHVLFSDLPNQPFWNIIEDLVTDESPPAIASIVAAAWMLCTGIVPPDVRMQMSQLMADGAGGLIYESLANSLSYHHAKGRIVDIGAVLLRLYCLARQLELAETTANTYPGRQRLVVPGVAAGGPPMPIIHRYYSEPPVGVLNATRIDFDHACAAHAGNSAHWFFGFPQWAPISTLEMTALRMAAVGHNRVATPSVLAGAGGLGQINQIIDSYRFGLVTDIHIYFAYGEPAPTPAAWPPQPGVGNTMPLSIQVVHLMKVLASLTSNVGRYIDAREMSRTFLAHAPGPEWGGNAGIAPPPGPRPVPYVLPIPNAGKTHQNVLMYGRRIRVKANQFTGITLMFLRPKEDYASAFALLDSIDPVTRVGLSLKADLLMLEAYRYAFQEACAVHGVRSVQFAGAGVNVLRGAMGMPLFPAATLETLANWTTQRLILGSGSTPGASLVGETFCCELRMRTMLGCPSEVWLNIGVRQDGLSGQHPRHDPAAMYDLSDVPCTLTNEMTDQVVLKHPRWGVDSRVKTYCREWEDENIPAPHAIPPLGENMVITLDGGNGMPNEGRGESFTPFHRGWKTAARLLDQGLRTTIDDVNVVALIPEARPLYASTNVLPEAIAFPANQGLRMNWRLVPGMFPWFGLNKRRVLMEVVIAPPVHSALTNSLHIQTPALHLPESWGAPTRMSGNQQMFSGTRKAAATADQE
jgi:hypothetical protein